MVKDAKKLQAKDLASHSKKNKHLNGNLATYTLQPLNEYIKTVRHKEQGTKSAKSNS